MPESTVMIVDGDPDSRHAQEMILALHLPSCDVISCENAKEALDIAESRPIDGALIDVHIPDIDGVDLCRRFKDELSTRQIPIMLISQHQSSPEFRIRGLEAGADDFITQPIDEIEFIARLRVMLRIKHAEDKQRAATDRLQEVVAEHTAALHSSEERYRRLVEISPDMIAVCTDGKMTFVSDAGVRMLRASSVEDFVDISIVDIVHPDSRPRMEKLLIDCTEKDEGTPFVEMQLTATDGACIDVEAAAVPFEYQGRRHVQLEVRDITERKQFGERVKQSQRMEAVGRLAGGVAHDFNNVLTTIRGYSELVLDTLNPGDPLCEDIEEIRNATERAASLTRQLLAFSRRQVLESRALDLNRVVSDMKRMLERMIGEDIDLVTDLDAGLSTIKADQSQIEQVLMNLAVNARDAIQDGGKLTVRTRNVLLTSEEIHDQGIDLEPGPYSLLEVEDTGIGMSSETAFHIFEPFFSTKPKDQGTGLGLSTVYGVVKQSDGDITVVSEQEIGTIFRIYLPAAPEEDVFPTPIRIPGGVAMGWETILLVEDEKTVRMLSKRMLVRAGYKVLEAQHGGEALLLSEQHDKPIHLILTDVVMPEMGGRELIERLLKTQPDVRVLLMSGYSDDAVLRASELLSNVAFLQKPFSYEELTKKVRAVLDGEPAKLRN
ncbi:MAG: response regulator [Deltaproteobacteria bacterium]|nr:response regulator [Deltaproteobacteria bacterium]